MTPREQPHHDPGRCLPGRSMLPAFVAVLVAFLLTSSPSVGADATSYDRQIRPFLVQHCGACHQGKKPKGDFRLDQLSPDFTDAAAQARWRMVLEQLQVGTMPPKPKPRPPEKELQVLTNWIVSNTAAANLRQRAAEGRTVFRRLNRVEYSNTVRDLLGIQDDLRELLARDGAMDGFDNIGAALHLSSFALERYVEAADTALDLAIANRPKPRPAKKRCSLKDAHNVKSLGNKYYRILDDDTVVLFVTAHFTDIHVLPFFPRDRGNYRFRISASGFQSGGKPITFGVSSPARGASLHGARQLVGYFDVPADKPTVIEFEAYLDPRRGGIQISPHGLGSAVVKTPGGAAQYQGPGLAVHWVEMEGPLGDTWPPAGHSRLFGDLKQDRLDKRTDRLEVISKNPEADAERILRGFARRAFRRPVSDDDLKPLLAVVKVRHAEKDSFEQAVRAGLVAVLVSPKFLFLKEQPGKLDDFALASRLSYFLWSSTPDEELFRLAEQKKLSQPEILRQQVERMLQDSKSAAFTTNFCGQWLNLREIDSTAPHYLLYPEWDNMLEVSMVRETELFFAEILKNDLSVMNFIASDFSMLNGRLAKHYGIAGVEGLWQFRKVPLPAGSHRGGVLTMGSVLKVTADGATTSPVKRGAWILERILGTPPPRPPADVPPLESDTRGAKTLREQLAKHRGSAACASCHARIDPPGFALESFDAIGGWREYYRQAGWVAGAKAIPGKHYLRGRDVDATGETADGQRFQNIDEFKQLLLRDREQITRAVTERLATYATGAALEAADKPDIERIVANIRGRNYGLRTLVHEIVQSKMFQHK